MVFQRGNRKGDWQGVSECLFINQKEEQFAPLWNLWLRVTEQTVWEGNSEVKCSYSERGDCDIIVRLSKIEFNWLSVVSLDSSVKETKAFYTDLCVGKNLSHSYLSERALGGLILWIFRRLPNRNEEVLQSCLRGGHKQYYQKVSQELVFKSH